MYEHSRNMQKNNWRVVCPFIASLGDTDENRAENVNFVVQLDTRKDAHPIR